MKINQISKVPPKPPTPPLKWAGGKRWLVPHLKPLWEKHKNKRFVEPFCGGLAATLGLLPEKAWLNDINPHLINLYTEIKKGLRIDIELSNEEKFYYRRRDQFNALLKDKNIKGKKTAELFYYLNRSGFNGLCRFNSRGFYNIPFGRHTTINYLRDFKEYKKSFRRWKFTHTDFNKMKLTKDDFVYADPPYDVSFSQYSMEGFSWEDQVRLAKWLSKHPGPVILSNHATKRILELYTSLGFEIQILDAPRIISCTGDRKKVKEVLATRNL
ncbi:MAG TPA: Dam family site-specific DNA-(adenine-N6)-methyltransferase [Candidatus Paceibacterota bacterium]